MTQVRKCGYLYKPTHKTLLSINAKCMPMKEDCIEFITDCDTRYTRKACVNRFEMTDMLTK